MAAGLFTGAEARKARDDMQGSAAWRAHGTGDVPPLEGLPLLYFAEELLGRIHGRRSVKAVPTDHGWSIPEFDTNVGDGGHTPLVAVVKAIVRWEPAE